MSELTIENWGTLPYMDALERQRQYVSERLEDKRADTLILVEHPPVYTLGARIGSEQHLIWKEAQLKQEGIEVIKTNRGGDITYHGPGQLVAYPIVDLRSQRDLHAWLRLLEDVIINVIATFGINGSRREGKTGIWIDNRKIAAIGVAVRQWITYHGFALNVNPKLEHFTGIVPCGIQNHEGTVTSILAETGNAPDMQVVKDTVIEVFTNKLENISKQTSEKQTR